MAKQETLDSLTQAVLHREEIAALIEAGASGSREATRDRVVEYVRELRTRQRLGLYKYLKYPISVILFNLERIVEHPEFAQRAVCEGRVLWVSNHKSHTDYLMEPVALDAHRIRPPLIAAGINLFGGPLGLLHRHVTGAIPIRRNTRDPVYLTTLKAYVGELLHHHDLLFYLEGGRSYSGDLRPPKTGLLHAALQARRTDLSIVPIAVAYDLVLEDRALARQGTKRRQRAFSKEMAEMARYWLGYRSRVFVTFGEPISTREVDPDSRTDVLEFGHRIREAIGTIHKVLPTALVASAMQPSTTKVELESRVTALLDRLRRTGANLATDDASEAVDDGVSRLSRRGVILVERDRLRVRDRSLLRYYARTIAHLLPPSEERT
jgi:glycerol-3-phosphate O-acyltransferase